MRSCLITICAMLCSANLWAADAAPDSNPGTRELVNGNNHFAVDLYGQLKNQNGNLFFSPESISTALAMTYAGARGETAAQMADALHFSLDQARLHPAMAALLQGLNNNGAAHGYELKVANALWAQDGFTFENDFMNLVQNNYAASVKQVDFIHAAEAARATINEWVEEATAHKIKDLIPAGALGDATRLVLTNAVYFKGSWITAFDKAQTRDEDFHLTDGCTVTTKMMHHTGTLRYFENDALQAIELPYKGDDLVMQILLPKAVDGLAGLEQSLAPESLESWTGGLHSEEDVQLTLPAFKVTAQFGLNDTLAALGMRDAFLPMTADFSGMDGKRDLYISKVIHKAFVDVNEEGTEAAAATAVVATLAMARMERHEPPVFRADHPFLFLIRDRNTGGILFMGRLSDPSQAD